MGDHVFAISMWVVLSPNSAPSAPSASDRIKIPLTYSLMDTAISSGGRSITSTNSLGSVLSRTRERLGFNSRETPRTQEIDFAAFSPNAEFVAVVEGEQLKIFKADLEWRNCWSKIVRRDTRRNRIETIALSKSLVAVAARTVIVVYELDTEDENEQEKSPVITLEGISRLQAIALSENGNRICAGTGDSKLLIWEIQGGNDDVERGVRVDQGPEEISLEGGSSTTPSIPYAVAFSSDGLRICAGSLDGYIHVYKLGDRGWLGVKPILLEGDFVSTDLPCTAAYQLMRERAMGCPKLYHSLPSLF